MESGNDYQFTTLAFAIVSPLAPKFGRRLGNERAALFGLILLFAGIGIRSIPYTSTLFIGTAIIGVGIVVMNVLLPAVIKEKFPHKIGQMTSVYSTSMAIFAATASGLAVPLAEGAGLGWELALLSWAVLAVIGIVVWIFVLRQDSTPKEIQVKISTEPFNDSNLWKSPLAWQITMFMGLQSFLFYVMISWLPEIMQSFGFSVSAPGWLVAYAQFIGLLFDITQAWTVPLIVIIAVCFLMTLAGLGAGRNKYV